MSFGSIDMIVAFSLGLFLGGIYGFICFALCAIQREEKFKREVGWYD